MLKLDCKIYDYVQICKTKRYIKMQNGCHSIKLHSLGIRKKFSDKRKSLKKTVLKPSLLKILETRNPC